MTEDEAKTKWCPFARVASPLAYKAESAREETWIGVAGANRGALSDRVKVQTSGDASNPASARCIGSACMAWRATKDKTRDWHDEERELHEERHGKHVPGGFCGLAGASQ